MPTATLTPMFRQYRSLKAQEPDAILLFRMGDFYEMFYDDAQIASRLLELTLTSRGKGTDHVVPMCGFPHHQLDAYAMRLIRANQRVAICDQVEDPREAKGLVRREVVRVVTPGTINDPSQIDAKTHLWLAALAGASGRIGAAFLDVSTGEFQAWETERSDAGWDALADRLASFSPREIVHAEDFAVDERVQRAGLDGAVFSRADAYAFANDTAVPLLLRHFGVASLDGFGLRDRPAATAAAGALLQYAQETQRCRLEHIDGLTYHETATSLLLDASTRRNLELERGLREGARRASLFHAIDATLTAAGGRLLRTWLLAPLRDPAAIEARLDGVEAFLREPGPRRETRDRLKPIHDVERLLARTVAGTAHPRDLQALGQSLARLPDLLQALAPLDAALIRSTRDGLDPCPDVAGRIAAGLVDEPPASLRDGMVIRDGFDAELDELRTIGRDGRSYLAALEAREREATGIASLKVRFNKVFGYFIEVSKPNLRLVPERYMRKQTVANGERYITPELKEYEARILNAQSRIEELEQELFRALRAEVAAHASRLKAVARATALVDVLAALADLAEQRDYCRPRVDESRRLRIVGGRHPVVEQAAPAGRFVPNDTDLEAGAEAIAVLTGPNMGGKSTYLRQVALIVLLAQAGSFVPAESAEIGIVDRIFCRVGASDSVAEGQSTFMVEMTETANILHHASPRSLLLLDEVGRGTSTFDGMSIAWAVVEALVALPGGAPRTVFATHYHELTELAVELDQVVNLRSAVREKGDGVLFLHRIEAGASDRSYGIQVARLAGVPQPVVDRASEILANLERDEFGRDGMPRRARRRERGEGADRQASLFEELRAPRRAPETPPAVAEILAQLREQDPDRVTPIEALNLLAQWHRRLRGSDPA